MHHAIGVPLFSELPRWILGCIPYGPYGTMPEGSRHRDLREDAGALNCHRDAVKVVGVSPRGPSQRPFHRNLATGFLAEGRRGGVKTGEGCLSRRIAAGISSRGPRDPVTTGPFAATLSRGHRVKVISSRKMCHGTRDVVKATSSRRRILRGPLSKDL
jgi:hypothetical protein